MDVDTMGAIGRMAKTIPCVLRAVNEKLYISAAEFCARDWRFCVGKLLRRKEGGG